MTFTMGDNDPNFQQFEVCVREGGGGLVLVTAKYNEYVRHGVRYSIIT